MWKNNNSCTLRVDCLDRRFFYFSEILYKIILTIYTNNGARKKVHVVQFFLYAYLKKEK